MPVYDYKCKEHGVFFELQTLSNHDKPVPCPHCGKLCARIIQLPPDILVMPKHQKQAFERNEKAQHEPIHSKEDQREHDGHHRKQCGCDHKKNPSKLMYTAMGEKFFPSMRPWMISH